MSLMRKAMALVLTLMLIFSCAALPAAQADTGVKAGHGAFAAEALGRIFMILPTDIGSSLYSMPAQGGAVTLIESAPQINDLIAGPDGSVYYLRYTGAAFEAVVRTADGLRTVLASFAPGQIAYSLTYYDGALFCLVDNKLTRIERSGAGFATVSEQEMGAYTIADGIVYYESRADEASYSKAYAQADGTEVTVTSSAGRLYAMNMDGSSDMQQFSQGVSNLAAFGDYVYFHNYNDSYVVAGTPDAWLDGKLYRLNVQTGQPKLLREGYDWNYRPVDEGLVIYQEKSISISTQDGANPVTLYEPDPYNFIALLDDCALVYEYNQQIFTRVPYDQTGAVRLWSGAFVTDGAAGEVIDETQKPTGTAGSASNAGSANAGSSNAGSSNAGSSNAGSSNAGSANAGSSNAGSSNAGSSGTSGTTANGSLMYGAAGERVRDMQKRLKELGYLSYVDGVFGEQTLTAVKRFQRAAGLTADGIAGEKTLKALNRSDAPEYSGSNATDSSYIFPNSSKKKLTEDDVLSINKSLWPYARNEIYARHGYKFTQSKYKKYFENKTWYRAGGFSTSDLNSIEWYNMELIAKLEDQYASDSGSGVDYEDEYIFPQSDSRKLTKAEIREVDEELWPFARNEIYARHGYKFTKKEFKNYFESKSWYKAGGFDTKNISEIEWYNMELIRWMEENEG